MSRWGNFLSGIESGLDKILQDNEADTSGTKSPEKPAAKSTPSRAASTRPKNDRLQERLSRAVEGRSSGESARAQSKSRTADTLKEEVDEEPTQASNKAHDASTRHTLEGPASDRQSLESRSVTETTKAKSMEPTKPLDPPEPPPTQAQNGEALKPKADTTDGAETGDHFYLERIEALQAKLNLLFKEAADKARDEQQEPGQDANAKKVAQQNEKIALLMAEGQSLSEKELKHVGTIRRLHSRANDLESSLTKARKAESDAQRDIKNWRNKAEEAASAQKTAAADDEAKATLLRQLEQVKKQNESQAKELGNLRNDLEKARANSDLKPQFDKQKQQLDSERRTIEDLREEIDNARIEKELSVGRQKSHLDEQRSKASQDRERATAREAELQGEIKTLESRLETMRTRREEETGGTGETQAKQLRQIEALQRQYSVSKENWGSVEASLNSRIASLEVERDDLVKKEAEFRRKLREATSNARKRDEELDGLKASYQEVEDKLQSRRQLEESTINELKESLQKARKETDEAQREAEEAREAMKAAKASLAIQSDNAASAERTDDASIFSHHDRSQSPMATRVKSPFFAQGGSRERRPTGGLGYSQGNGVYSDRPPSSRKVSVALPHMPSNASYRQHSFQSLTRSSSRSALRETGSVDDERDASDGLRTPATPGRGFNDVVSASASNPAAGPSVQLVERMSAAVRRLESEKAATRDELDRMSLERDETRQQVVSLLEEVESKRSLDKRVAELETQVLETSQRYQTTLELLGEKSEAVEELKADIADMKQIYREALEKSMK